MVVVNVEVVGFAPDFDSKCCFYDKKIEYHCFSRKPAIVSPKMVENSKKW
jgi:hypothetical protein